MEQENIEDYLWDLYGINDMCATCKKLCKQHNGVILVHCPVYEKLDNPEEDENDSKENPKG